MADSSSRLDEAGLRKLEEERLRNKPSFFCIMCSITSIFEDIEQWNKDWERVIKTMTDPKAVYDVLSMKWPTFTQSDRTYYNRLRRLFIPELQNSVADTLERELDRGQLDQLWILLSEETRKRHMLEGLKRACGSTAFSQDLRAICPEITITRLSKERGQGFIDLLRHFVEVRRTSTSMPFTLPSPWWEGVLAKLPNPLPERHKDIYETLTMLRGEFIGFFIRETRLSVNDQLKEMDDEMRIAIDRLRGLDMNVLKALTDTAKTQDGKQLIRCAACRKSAVELGGKTKFMACRTCLSNLNIKIYYCSRKCQVAHWPQHKETCGKQEPAVQAPSTPWETFSLLGKSDTTLFPKEYYRNRRRFLAEHSKEYRRQITALDRNKIVDYFLYDATSSYGIKFDGKMRDQFRQVRAAVLGGQTSCLPLMAELLIRSTPLVEGFTRSMVLDQLKREYRVDSNLLDQVALLEERSAVLATTPQETEMGRVFETIRSMQSRRVANGDEGQGSEIVD